MIKPELIERIEGIGAFIKGEAQELRNDSSRDAQFCASVLNQIVATLDMRFNEMYGVNLKMTKRVEPVQEVAADPAPPKKAKSK